MDGVPEDHFGPIFIMSSGQCLHPTGLGNGAAVLQGPFLGRPEQLFRPVHCGSGHFRIDHLASRRVLEIRAEGGPSNDNGAPLQLWDWWGGENQQFQFTSLDGHSAQLVVRNSGKALDINNGSQDQGARIQQWNSSGADHQRFRWRAGAAPIILRGTGQCLQADGTGDGADVRLADALCLPSQLFRLDPLGEGWFKLTHPATGKVLDVDQSSGRLQLYGFGWGANQQFRLAHAGSGYVSLVSRHSALVLTVEADHRVVAAPGSPDRRQHWML